MVGDLVAHRLSTLCGPMLRMNKIFLVFEICDETSQPPQKSCSRQSRFAIGHSQFRASCHLCPWVAEFTCNDNASKARWRHYHTCHPGACMVSFRALERRVETQPIGKNFKGQLAWKCAFCTHGIPTSDLCTQNRVFRAYKRHRLKAHPKIPVKKWVVAQKKLRFQHHGAMLKRVQTLNATAGKVKSKAFSPEKWHIATWPLIQKYASGRLQLSTLRAWKCKICKVTCRKASLAKKHQCGRSSLASRQAAQKRKLNTMSQHMQFVLQRKAKNAPFLAAFTVGQLKQLFNHGRDFIGEALVDFSS